MDCRRSSRVCLRAARGIGNGISLIIMAGIVAEFGKRHDQVWAQWQQESRKDWDASPLTFSRLAMEVWDVIKDEDWVLTANELKHQVRKLWDFDKPYRHPGVELGTSTQIGISLGVALANREKGRLVVDIQPDGDLMFDAGA